jgi:hypothetical protein
MFGCCRLHISLVCTDAKNQPAAFTAQAGVLPHKFRPPAKPIQEPQRQLWRSIVRKRVDPHGDFVISSCSCNARLDGHAATAIVLGQVRLKRRSHSYSRNEGAEKDALEMPSCLAYNIQRPSFLLVIVASSFVVREVSSSP